MFEAGSNFNVSVKFLAELKQFIADLERGATAVDGVGNAVQKQKSKFIDTIKTIGMYTVGIGSAVQALGMLKNFIEGSVKAAEEARRVNQELADSLKAVGQYSLETTEELKQLASKYQDLYVVNDEVIKGIMGTILGLTELSTEALPDATRAVLGLATLYKMDYQSAALLLGKTLSSNTNAFRRQGIEVDMTKDAIGRLADIMPRAERGLVILEGKLDDVTGKIEAQKLKLDDLREEVGDRWLPTQYAWFSGLNDILAISNAVSDAMDRMINIIKSIPEWEINQILKLFNAHGRIGGVTVPFGEPGALGRSIAPGAVISGALGMEAPEDVYRELSRIPPMVKFGGGGGGGVPKGTTEDPVTVAVYGFDEIMRFADFVKQYLGKWMPVTESFKTLITGKPGFKEPSVGWQGGTPWYPRGMGLQREFRERYLSPIITGGEAFIGSLPGWQAPGFGKWKHREFGTGEGVELPEKEEIEKPFQDLGEAINNAITELVKSIQTGDIAGAVQNAFNLLGQAIGANITKMINATSSGGSGIFAGALGALGGGLVGVGISLLGGLFGGGDKDRGAEPSKPIYTWVTNWDSFFKMGMTLPLSFVYSGRSGGYGVDPHGRTLAGYSTGQHFDL